MYVGPPVEPTLMTGTIGSDSIQVVWNGADSLACGSVTYHVELRVRADERLVKQDTTMNRVYTFTGLAPGTHYTAYVYGTNQAGDGQMAIIQVTTFGASTGEFNFRNMIQLHI